MAQRKTVVLQVTTIFPVVPVGTFAITNAAASLLVIVFVTCLIMVAVTPPMVMLVSVNPAPAFLAIAETMIYLPASAAPRFCVVNV